MRIIVFGLGFIATHLAIELSSMGEVLVTYRNLTPLKREYASLLRNKAELVKIDPLTNDLGNIINGADAVVNAIGALSGDLRATHIEVPKLITRAAVKAGATLIHISASNVLGPRGSFVAEEEKHCEGAAPSNEYEYTKCEGEKVVYGEAMKGGIPFAIIRPTLVYGEYAAHGEWLLMYRAAKLGIIPKVRLSVSSISAASLARMVRELIRVKPHGLYMYATECGQVPIYRFMEIMSAALLRRVIKVPTPSFLAMLALPSSVRQLAKYAGVSYDCSKSRELIGELTFDEEQVRRNALFLKRLEELRISGS